MTHVFISYSKKNKDYALKLVNKLRDEGFDVWIDDRRLRSSEDWWSSIVAALWSCGAFVVILSPESDASRWVQREIMLADQRQKPIYPLWLGGELDTPNWALLVRTQYEDVRGGKLPSREFFEMLASDASRKPQRGENVTATGNIQKVIPANDSSLIEAMQHPPEADEDETSADVITPAPARRPPRWLAVLALVGLAVIGIILVTLVLPPPTPPTPTQAATATGTDWNGAAADVETLNAWRQQQGYEALVIHDTLNALTQRHLSYLSSISLSDLPGISWYHDSAGRDIQSIADEAGYPGPVEMFVDVTDGDVTLESLLFMIETQGAADSHTSSRHIGLAKERSIDTGKLYFVLLLGG